MSAHGGEKQALLTRREIPEVKKAMDSENHTSTAKRIDNLIGLLLVVKPPSLLESPYRLRLHVGSLVLLAKVEAIENKNTSHAQVLKDLQLSLDVVLQCEWETTECDQERFAG